MRKLYAEPLIDIRKYNMTQVISTSEPGPPNLDDGEDLDPDNINGGISTDGYFAD